MKSASKKVSDNLWYLAPVLIAMSIVPLIVMLKVVPMDQITSQNWTGGNENYDFFSYYKVIFLGVSAILAVITLLVSRYRDNVRIKSLKSIYIAIGVYTLFVILSTLLSKYSHTALFGYADRYEGFYILISYIVILFAAINLVRNEKMVKAATIALFLSALIIGTIGIFQFIGLDLFKSEFGKLLILPPQYHSVADTLNFTFGKYTIYSTLYNTNYVGSYMVMLFALSLVSFIYVKKPYLKIITGIFTCLMFANLIGCGSRTGYIAGLLAFILVLILLRNRIIQNWPRMLIVCVCYLIILFGLNAISNGELIGRVVSGASEGDIKTVATTSGIRIKDIQLAGKSVTIVSNTDSIRMEMNGNNLMFYGSDKKELTLNKDTEGVIRFADPKFSKYYFKYISDQNVMEAHVGEMVISFFLQDTGFKIVGERGILLDKIDHPESIGFVNKERFFSSRGYIWSRSLPLLKKTLFYGFGPDTFAIYFPQHDYVGKLNAFGMVGEIVDKPHDMYLQTGINTGVISLLALIALYLIYFVSSIRIYFRSKFTSFMEVFGAGAFAAVFGYLVTGLGNDSLVSVAPVFWAILGFGIGCNYIIGSKKAVTSEQASGIAASNKKANNKPKGGRN